MPYKNWTRPKRWRVKTCDGDLGVQVSDVLEFIGDGKGNTGSKLCRSANGKAAEWGSRCLYVNGNSETVTGIHKATGQTFTISRTTLAFKGAILKCTLSGSGKGKSEGSMGPVKGKPKPGSSGSGSGAGGGSWTAEEGG